MRSGLRRLIGRKGPEILMSKVKSPTEKKRLAYQRDHFNSGVYPHGFRASWPKKKAVATRAHRRTVGQRLEAALHRDAEAVSDINVGDIRRRIVRKWEPTSLRQRVVQKLERRRNSVGAKKRRRTAYFSPPS
jgi:hypothetical protein